MVSPMRFPLAMSLSVLLFAAGGCRCSPAAPSAVVLRVKNDTQSRLYVDDTEGQLGIELQRRSGGSWTTFDEWPCACNTCEGICNTWCECASEGQGLGNKFLSHIRAVDAILEVVRCFENEDVTHVDGDVDPLRDITTIETELLLADLQQVEESIHKANKLARGGDKESIARVAVLEVCQKALAAGQPVRSLTLDEEQQRLVKGMGMLSAKRILYVANVNEDNLQGDGPLVAKVREYAAANGGEVVVVCAKIESELAELEEADRAEMLESLGMKEPALAAVARSAYHLLGLQSFFTAGEKENRAWPVAVGSTAPQAAGVIHSDFERGFIRAEIYSVNDLAQYGSESAIRAAGKLRVEGKSYVMQDSDVCHFLFNV